MPSFFKVDADIEREYIRLFLIRKVGIPVDADDLYFVSGTSQYHRRVRELRVQDGYKILSCAGNDPDVGVNLQTNQYLLLSTEPDREAAYRWHMARRIRRDGGSAQCRILSYLKTNVGKVVTSEELHYLTQNNKFGQRTRELRTKRGYAVATRFTGRPDLHAGEYILEDIERVLPPHDRDIPEDIQKLVYERDNNTCQFCFWNHMIYTRKDPRYLELHNCEEKITSGNVITENLLILCNRCHDYLHSGLISLRNKIILMYHN